MDRGAREAMWTHGSTKSQTRMSNWALLLESQFIHYQRVRCLSQRGYEDGISSWNCGVMSWWKWAAFAQSFSHVQLLRPHGVVLQAPLSMGFSGQEYRSGLPFPPPSGQPLETGKVREPFLSKSPEGWFLAPVRLIGDFWPPELWMILSFLKPPRVWQSVAAAIGNESEHSQQVHQLVVIVSQSRKKRSGKGLPPPTQDGTAGLPGFLNPQSWVSLESTSAGKQGGQRLMEPKALTCVVSINTPRASNTQFLLGPPEPRL